MTVFVYEDQFSNLDNHAKSILSIEYEQILCFIWVLILHICMATYLHGNMMVKEYALKLHKLS